LDLKWIWIGSLKIQSMPTPSELDLKSRPGLKEIWHGSQHIPDLYFSELATLVVDDCQFLLDVVLPFPLLPLCENCI